MVRSKLSSSAQHEETLELTYKVVTSGERRRLVGGRTDGVTRVVLVVSLR